MSIGSWLGSSHVVACVPLRSSGGWSHSCVACDAAAACVVVVLAFGDVAVLLVCRSCAGIIEGAPVSSLHPEAQRSAQRRASKRGEL